jgi:hypothetical protein
MKAGGRDRCLAIRPGLDDVFDFLDLVLRAFPRIDVGDVDDGFLGRIEHRLDVIEVGAGVEEIADVERLQVLVAVELLVIGVGDGLELGFVLGASTASASPRK